MDKIPLIDLAGGSEAPDDDARIAREIGAACRSIGFFYVINHGVDPALTARVFDRSAAFFALETARKADLAIARVGNNRGYVGLKTEALDPARGGDRKEAFNIGHEPALDPDLAERSGGIANVWPDVPGFQQTMTAYFGACLTLGRQLHRAFARDLALGQSFFADKLDRPMATLRLLHYPPADAGTQDLGAGVHTDYGNITLLATDAVGGLEVQARDGTWLKAPVIANAFVVNIGDCLMRWTNDIYVSTPHRVVSPAGRERYSVAFFLDPNEEALVTALPGTVPHGQSPHYAPLTAREHLMQRFAATYGTAG